MCSLDSEEMFEKYLRELAAMTPEQKRKHAERMDKAADSKDEINLLKQRDVLVREGREGVHRPDMFI